MKNLLYLFLVLVVVSCNLSEQNPPEETPTKEDLTENTDTSTAPDTLRIYDEPYYDRKVYAKGDRFQEHFWRDANGYNRGIFTQAQATLFVYHYLLRDDTTMLLQTVSDAEGDCEFDLFLSFVESSISITDVDENGVGEITFAYKKACLSDVSPLDLRLVMLENGQEYVINGTTIVNTGAEMIGGRKEAGPAFKGAPGSFLAHANEVWEVIQNKNK